MRQSKLRALVAMVFPVGGAVLAACTASDAELGGAEDVGATEQALDTNCIERGGPFLCAPILRWEYRYPDQPISPWYLSEQEAIGYFNSTFGGQCSNVITEPVSAWDPSHSYVQMRYYHHVWTVWYDGSCIFGGENDAVRLQRQAICPAGWTVAQSASGSGEPPFCQYLYPEKFDNSSDCTTDKPVNTRTGSKLLTETDVAPAGPAALGWTRRYNSGAPHGRGKWQSEYHRAVKGHSTGNTAIVYRHTGALEKFVKSGANWVAPAGSSATFTRNLDADGGVAGWTYRSEDGEVEQYDAAGLLVSITRPGGQVLTLSYSGGQLTSISDAFGRTLTIAYNGAGDISSVTDSAGQVTSYAYSNGQLASVTRPGGATRQYLYEVATDSSLVTGIVDENGSRMSTYAYDSSGRVTSSSHAGGVGQSTFVYGTWGSSDPQTTVTDALGTSRIYQYKKLATTSTAYRLTSISQPSPIRRLRRRIGAK